MKKLAGIFAILVLSTGWTWFGFGTSSKRAAWENGGRAAVLKWFGENQFGVTPIGRPADEVIGERSVTFANGTITIDIHVSLPEGASAEHPAPVFIFGDHCGAKEKTPPHDGERVRYSVE